MQTNSHVESKNLGSTISFRVNEAVYESFVAQCEAANLTKSELFRDYIAKNKVYVNARPIASRETRRAVALLQRVSNNMNDLLRRANSDGAAGSLPDTYYIEFIKQLAQLNQFLYKQAAGARRDS